MPPRFLIEKKENHFGFSIIGEKDNILLWSRLFRTIKHCREGIEELKSVVSQPQQFEKVQDRHGQYSFVIRNSKGISLGRSQVFTTEDSRDEALCLMAGNMAEAVHIEEKFESSR